MQLPVSSLGTREVTRSRLSLLVWKSVQPALCPSPSFSSFRGYVIHVVSPDCDAYPPPVGLTSGESHSPFLQAFALMLLLFSQ